MTDRPQDDFAHERQMLDAMHAQNEAQRDSFIGLAHTALFAASVSFVGDVTPLSDAVWRPMLILGWSADVVGLLALTASFGAARKAIDARRDALLDPDPPSGGRAELLNNIALWCFPVALLSLFSFVTANVVHADDRQAQPPPSAVVTNRVRSSAGAEISYIRDARRGAAATSAQPRRSVNPVDRNGSRAPCAGSPATGRAPARCTQEIDPSEAAKPVAPPH